MYCSKWRVPLLLVGLLFSSFSVAGEIIGKTYAIKERDLLVVIAEKLREKKKSGELALFEQRVKDRVKQSIHQPTTARHIQATLKPETRYYDPSITVPYAIRDAEGQVIHPAGTRVNPLDYQDLRYHLLFFDGDDAKQRASVSRYTAKQPEKAFKLILVSGSPLKLMKELKTQIFFDQGGQLVDRFEIQQVPAVVFQEGKRLRIDEFEP